MVEFCTTIFSLFLRPSKVIHPLSRNGDLSIEKRKRMYSDNLESLLWQCGAPYSLSLRVVQ